LAAFIRMDIACLLFRHRIGGRENGRRNKRAEAPLGTPHGSLRSLLKWR